MLSNVYKQFNQFNSLSIMHKPIVYIVISYIISGSRLVESIT